MSISIESNGGIATVVISQPDRRNALTAAMRDELGTTFDNLHHDPAVKSVLLVGAGEHFCAGADLLEPGGGGIPGSIARIDAIGRMITSVASTPRPVIAAVRGVCAGLGWALALACDFVVAADDARFQFAFPKVGLAPDGGAIHQLARHVGLMRAKEIAYSGRVVSGAEALGLGLALAAVPAAELMAAARACAAGFGAVAPLSLAMAKRQFKDANATSLAQTLSMEAMMQPLLAHSDDFAEGIASFREKRNPRFCGR